MSDVVVLVPMLGRAHLVARLLDSIQRTSDARVLWLLTPGDEDVWTEVSALGGEAVAVPWQRRGDYARKINIGYRQSSEPLLFLGAIDLVFHPGWLDGARAALGPGIGVVGTNDLGSPRVIAGQHSTHSLVTREYADRYGTIDHTGEVLHEGYHHEYVDDELVGTAKHRGAWAFAFDSHVEHRHPNWDAAVPMDDIYRQQRYRMRASAPLYRKRRRLWT